MARILVIDDDEKACMTLKKALTRAGFEVLTAPDGRIGLELCSKEHPDVVITDIIMPEKDGAEVIYELQKNLPDIRIIAMTSGGGPTDAQAYLKSIMKHSQVKDAFVKPLDVPALVKAVERLTR